MKGDRGRKREAKEESAKQREKSGKRFQAGRDEETQTKIASPNRQVEREREREGM